MKITKAPFEDHVYIISTHAHLLKDDPQIVKPSNWLDQQTWSKYSVPYSSAIKFHDSQLESMFLLMWA